MRTIGPLTEIEQQILDDLVAGHPTDCRDSNGSKGRLAAVFLRDVLRGIVDFGGDPDPYGLRIFGADIYGPLDLSYLSTKIPFYLEDCTSRDPLSADYAHLESLILRNCYWNAGSRTAVCAVGLTVTHDVDFEGLHATSTDGDAVRLIGANIGARLSFAGARLTSETGTALAASNISVASDMHCAEGFRATSKSGTAVNLMGASIGGILSFTGAHLEGDTGALFASGLRVSSHMFCNDGFEARSTEANAVTMSNASVGGSLSFADARLSSETGTALQAIDLQVASALHCNGHFEANGSEATVQLSYARIGPLLNFSGGRMIASAATALEASGLHVTGSVSFFGFEASSTDGAAVRLNDATIGGLGLGNASLASGAGTALEANGLAVSSNMACSAGFSATSNTADAVSLMGAKIGRVLSFAGAHLASDTGTALKADGLTVSSNMFCGGGFSATSNTADAVSLMGASIGGMLLLSGAHLASKTGTALHCHRIQVTSNMLCTNGFEATTKGGSAALVLTGGSIGGKLMCRPGANGGPSVTGLDVQDASVNSLELHHGFGPAAEHWFSAEGLTYQHAPQGMSTDQWIDCLRRQTHHAMQPWRQLAASYSLSGRDSEARKILIAQQTAHREWLKTQPAVTRRAKVGRAFLQFVLGVSGMTTGYGYQTWRAAIGLLIIGVLSVGLGFTSGYIHADVPGPAVYVAQHSRLTGDEGRPCSKAERVALGVQIGLPLVKLPASDRCILDSTSVAGQAVTVLSWILQLLGWAFATLVVVGYTGVIRRL